MSWCIVLGDFGGAGGSVRVGGFSIGVVIYTDAFILILLLFIYRFFLRG